MTVSREFYNQIPNAMVYNYKDGESTIVNDLNDTNKAIFTVLAINQLTDKTRNICCCTISVLLHVMDVKLNQRNVKEIKENLQCLQGLKYIKSNIKDFLSVSANDVVVIEPNLFKLDSDGNKTQYFQLYDADVKKIMNSNYDLQKKYGLLKLFSFYSATVPNYNVELLFDCREPLASFHSYESIQANIGFNNKTICEYMKILEELDLIAYMSGGELYKVENGVRMIKNAPNFVTLKRKFINCVDENHYLVELRASIKRYLKKSFEDGWRLVKDDKKVYRNEKKRLSNKATRLALLQVGSPDKFTEKQRLELKSCVQKLRKLISDQKDKDIVKTTNKTLEIINAQEVVIKEKVVVKESKVIAKKEVKIKGIKEKPESITEKIIDVKENKNNSDLPDFITKNDSGLYVFREDHRLYKKGDVVDKSFLEQNFNGIICNFSKESFFFKDIKQNLSLFEALYIELDRDIIIDGKTLIFRDGEQLEMRNN